MTIEDEFIPEINDFYDKSLLNSFNFKGKKSESTSFKNNFPNIKIHRGEICQEMIEIPQNSIYLNSKEDQRLEDKTKDEIDINPERCNSNSDNYDFKQGSNNFLSTMVYGQENFIDERVKEEYVYRFKGMVLSIDEEKLYDTNPMYFEKVFEKLPWKNTFYYEEATDFKEYTYKQCDNSVLISRESSKSTIKTRL